MGRFHEIDREADFLFPPLVQGWLPNEHMARYIANVVEGLDRSAMERAYAGRGSDAYHPATLIDYWSDRIEHLRKAFANDRNLLPEQHTIDVPFHEFQFFKFSRLP